jgi:hypothetical protein
MTSKLGLVRPAWLVIIARPVRPASLTTWEHERVGGALS